MDEEKNLTPENTTSAPQMEETGKNEAEKTPSEEPNQKLSKFESVRNGVQKIGDVPPPAHRNDIPMNPKWIKLRDDLLGVVGIVFVLGALAAWMYFASPKGSDSETDIQQPDTIVPENVEAQTE